MEDGDGDGARVSVDSSLPSPLSPSRPAQDSQSQPQPQSQSQRTIPRPETTGSDMPAPRHPKVVTSGNGIVVSIGLTEPALFVESFDKNDPQSRKTAMLRGSLHLKVSKPLKVKKVYLNFKGQAIMSCPEGGTRLHRVPGKRNQYQQTHSFMNHTWTYFNTQFPTAEQGYGTDQTQFHDQRPGTANPKGPGHSTRASSPTRDFITSSGTGSSTSMQSTPKEMKRLSLQNVQSRSVEPGESAHQGPTVAQRGYNWFPPGDYIYDFELPVDSWYPETIRTEMATIKYDLEAIVERAGTFRPNLLGTREVPVIRIPSDGSLEHVEPIAITRTWDDQLRYEIIVSGKEFPMGAKIPVAVKLTPLAKVACHRVRVYVVESIRKNTSKKSAKDVDITKKLLLFEKRPNAPSASTFPGSSVRVTAGGGVDWDRRRAAAQGEEDFNPDRTNLLGDVNSDFGAGPTEMEFDVQLPTCSMMRDMELSDKLHCDADSDFIDVNHWIKIVLRLSRPDETNPSKRRHFEISIDSPFHIISCLARQANIYLPSYTTPSSASVGDFECGCPDFADVNRSIQPPSQRGVDPFSEQPTEQSATWDPEAGSAYVGGTSESLTTRPIHLIRFPSHAPPAFDEVPPPPPLFTPPPAYTTVATGNRAQESATDYFQEIPQTEEEYDDNARGSGRVDVPLTPGARVNRSMDISRDWAPIAGVVSQGSS